MVGRWLKRRTRRRGARLSLWATIGAWLRIWTPPKGVEVPAIPVRSLVLVGLALSGAVAVTATIVYPSIRARQRAAVTEERRADDARRVMERRRLELEQRPRRGRGVKPSAAALAARGGERRARRRLLRRLEAAISGDARARIRTGTLSGRTVRETRCRPHPATTERAQAEADMSLRKAAYSCVAITTRRPGLLALGHPFRAIVDYGDFSYAWCKVNPVPGERVVPDASALVPLSQACGG